MSRKDLFDQFADDYFKYRTYLPEEFGKKILSHLPNAQNLLDIGCGTGQATFAFSKYVDTVTAIDLGENLIENAKKHDQNSSNVDWITTSFEEFNQNVPKFDLIVSANAFHWIDPKVGYKKAADLLSNEGHLVLVSLSRKLPDNFRNKIDPLYACYKDVFLNTGSIAYPLNSESSLETRKDYFREVGVVEYSFETSFDADSYCGLMKTMSDHRSLNSDVQNSFFNKLRNLFDELGTIKCTHVAKAVILVREQARSNYSKCY